MRGGDVVVEVGENGREDRSGMACFVMEIIKARSDIAYCCSDS